jgi:hypothetical protein
MQKETILAKIRVRMKFNEKTTGWFEEIKRPNLWFAEDYGMNYLSEFGGTWNRILVATVEPEIQGYFRELGLSENKLPHVRVFESYPGSWIMEAAITMFASMGTAYTLLKGVSELPKIADGLTELKERLKKEFTKNADEEAKKYISSRVKELELPSPPKKLLDCDFTIDARPLKSLTPAQMKSHKVHLNVAVSREALSLENLGDDLMRDIQIGVFKSMSECHQWSYADSFMGSVDILSSKQTITKELSGFKNSTSTELDLSDNSPLHIDCWVQDNHGIYLFIFYLEKNN